MALPAALFLVFLSFFPLLTRASFSQQPLCQDHESSALVQLRNSFVISRHASDTSSGYPKTLSWKRHKDCCWWDGVECDAETGYVIGLDLSSSYLHGSISSNSSLFHLVHLRKLNLADNDFNYSQIPSEIGQLKALSYLNLSDSTLSGPVPQGISELSKLVSLDLSDNDYNGQPLLELDKHNLQRLVENLTSLEELHLSFVYVPFPLPPLLANLSSLTSLILENCWLQGTFPQEIFQLPKLQVLDVESNSNLTGQIPEFLSSSPLKELRLAFTSFFGSLPASIGNLNSLALIRVEESKFGGYLPSSLGNLTKLTNLNLAVNNFIGPIPSSLANLSQLVLLSFGLINNLNHGNYAWLNGHPKLAWLDLGSTNLFGPSPIALRNLTQLTYLDLSGNQLTGPISSWIPNLALLDFINLSGNQFHGPIPRSIGRLQNLENLILQENNFAGTLGVETFFNLTKLKILELGYNSLSLVTITNTTSNFKLAHLGLASCNLREFPGFIQNQDTLERLSLSDNSIHGAVPEWIWKASRNLQLIDLENNGLTGSINSSLLSQLTNLQVMVLADNKLQGTLPIPPSSINVYVATDNRMSGMISPSICKLHSLKVLDVSHNNFSGSLPHCLGNSSNYTQVLNLQNNSFEGIISWFFTPGNHLRLIDLSHNQLSGRIPRSMVHCSMLEKLDLGDNQISDVFPSWLGGLSQLQVLGLRSNKLNGRIGVPSSNFDFPKLRIIDLSHNELTGELQSKYFDIWNGMKAVQEETLTYMRTSVVFQFSHPNVVETISVTYKIDLALKGSYIQGMQIPETMVAIDLSSNKFEGPIPKSIGDLKALILLNVSNNQLSDAIPESMGNLASLEALDLSHNTLSGQIPQKLAALNFLEVFDVSDNDLLGSIPQGTQFDTFPNSSFQGNLGLCGRPLSNPCPDQGRMPGNGSTSNEGRDKDFAIKWVIISLGFGSGLVVGVILGNIFVERNDEWLAWIIFGQRTLRRARHRKVNKPTGSLQAELRSIQLQPGAKAKTEEDEASGNIPNPVGYEGQIALSIEEKANKVLRENEGALDENAKRREIARGKLPSIHGTEILSK